MIEALQIFRQKVLPGNIGQIVLFMLMKIVLGMGTAMASAIMGFCTCCIGFIPYVNTFLTLPAHMFTQAYDLYFVASFFDQNYFVEETTGFPVENVRQVVANPAPPAAVEPPPIPPTQRAPEDDWPPKA